jgi:DNA-binding transcriptional LysR family regulator
VTLRLALPVLERLAREAPRLRCEVLEGEPERMLPALALGDVDLVLGDEWPQNPVRIPDGVERHDLFGDPIRLVLPSRHALARAHPDAVPLRALAEAAWTTGPAGLGWDEMTRRNCRDLGGFEPDVRHRTNDPEVIVALAARGLGVALLPELALPRRAPGVALRSIAEGPVTRAVFAATRAADAARPSTRALLGAIREAAEAVQGG